jgi:hypothetical protein
MKKNIKELVEISLKTFSKKKKIGFTTGLLVSFLITGGIVFATNESIEVLENKTNKTQQELLDKIFYQKLEVEQLLKENEAKLYELRKGYMNLVKKGDWYSKSWTPSYFFSIIGDYRKSDNIRKNWQNSIRTDTPMDEKRKAFNAAVNGKNQDTDLQEAIDYTYDRDKTGGLYSYGNQSTGWLTGEKAYDENTNIYDYEDTFMILPVVKPPEVVEPTAPVVTFVVPAAPIVVPINPPTVANINVGTINVSSPTVTAPVVAVLPAVTSPTLGSINITEPNVSINPITINVSPTTPNFTINPTIPTITMNVKTPDAIIEPNPSDPNKIINVVEPNASPFSDFTWGWLSSTAATANTNTSSADTLSLGDNIDVSGGIFWSGVTPGSTPPPTGVFPAADANTAGMYNPTQNNYYGWGNATGFITRDFDRRHLSIINSYNGRWTGKVGNHISGGTFHVKGGSTGTSTGTEAFHLVGDVDIQNVTAYLYGRAAFINAEAFRGGQTTMSNVTINVVGDNNTIFHLKGSGDGQDAAGYTGGQFSTKFSGNANITVETKNNSVFAARNYAGGLRLENLGDITLNGASNIGFSFLTWVPDKSKYIAGQFPSYTTNGEGSIGNYIPYAKLAPLHPMKLNGDENVGIFFNKKISSYDVGIHQGYFELYFDIGTAVPGTSGELSKSGYTNGITDGSVGIYAISGQRTNVNRSALSTLAFFDSDPIHNLYMDKFDIKFGKYSKNGFMFFAKNGTVIEIKDVETQSFSDGINGTSTTEANASDGTIIAYAEGKWTATGTGLTGTDIENLPTEIIVGKALNMISKNGIAFFADTDGKITVTKDATAYGRSSIIGYARDNGKVAISSNIKAIDGGVTDIADKYQNIGAYAGVNGEVTITGNAEINGIMAFANGANAKVSLNGTGNIIRTGISGGLAAKNGGYVVFNGGTIEHKDVITGDHNGKVPFFADATSKINFTGTTTLNVYNGAVFYGSAADYTGASGTATKYNGMGKISVEIQGNGVNLGVFKGQNVTWNGEAGYLSSISLIPKVAGIDDNGFWYSSYLEGGTLAIDSNVTLAVPSSGGTKSADAFNDVTLEREKLTITAGKIISSTTGYGLTLGSNLDANKGTLKNLDSGYTNNGTINITGTNKVGIYTSYGYVDNTTTGAIIVDTGIAVVGANGSKITNSGVITVNATSGGVGIVGLARRVNSLGVVDTAENYGTDVTSGVDADNATNLIEIDNKGIITVAGTGGVAIYADNNIGGARARVVVKNNKALTLGNGGVGVMVKGAVDGGTITLSDATGTDITVGNNGIGIYGENSTITISGAPYEIDVKDNGIGIYTTGNSTLNTGNLKLNYTGILSGTATGLVYIGESGKTLTNNINIQVATPVGMIGTVSGIYTKGEGTLANVGNITSLTAKAYGIISESVDIQNTGIITTGVSSGTGGVGIYAIEASISTDGNKLMIDGTDSIGVYATDKAATLITKTISIAQGIGNLSVVGNNAIGIFIKDIASTNDKLILNNASNIDLTPSATDADRKIGIFLDGVQNTGNTNSALITVSGIATTGNNIGIYNKNSYLNQAGTITLTGVKNIGIFVESTGTDTSTLNLSGGTINVMTATMADTDISIGIYGKGNNISIISATSNIINVAPNAVGIYLEGTNGSTTDGIYAINLSSNALGKVGIGAYYKGGVSADGTINLNSTVTAPDSNGDPIRPIGLFYGDNSGVNDATINILASSQELIGIYGKQIASFTNNGDITLGSTGIGAYFVDSNVTNNGDININTLASNGYGLYFKGGISENNGTITANAADAVGVIITGNPTGTFTNKNIIIASAAGAIGIYAENGGKFVNDTGAIVNSTASDSIGAFSKNGVIENKGTVSTAYIGLYGKDGGKINQTSGTLTITTAGGIGIFVEGKDGVTSIASKTDLNGGAITGTNGTRGVFGTSDGIVNLNGTNITVGNSGVGIHLDDANGKLTSGNITVGTQGTAVYAKDSNLDLTGYSGTFTLGDKGIGIYSDNNIITTSTPTAIDINYATYTNKGVGIYYKGTNPINNVFSINHTGDNLVHIYADGTDVTNNANQVLLNEGIGLFIDNGSLSSNTATLALNGNNSVGIFIDKTGAGIGVSTLTNIGTITGTPAVTAGGSKVGIYVKNGDITGTSVYNFAIDGGVGIYLVNGAISYTGNLNLAANSTTTNRAIGVYVSDAITGNLNNNINITGADAIGMYLAKHPMLFQGANITYNGEIKITATSTLLNRGVGAVLDSYSTFTLSTSGKVEIGGTNNIGFYVKQDATLNVSGGTVTNTVDGVFAYIEGGAIHFTSGTPININYANIIVSGSSGSIINDTNINVGTGGLQATAGASILNSPTGIINGTVDEGKAMVGILGATITNTGNINLSGEKSVGIYVDGGAIATSTGNVMVGDKSVAYYAGEDSSFVGGTINISGTTSIGINATMIFANGGDVDYTGSDISQGEKATILTLANGSSDVDFNGAQISTGEKGVGVFLTGTGNFGTIQNLSKISTGKDATGIYIDNSILLNTNTDIDILGQNGIGILTTQNGNIIYGGQLNSSVIGAKGIISTGTGTISNVGTIKLFGNASIGIYAENSSAITNNIGATIEIKNGTNVSGVIESAVGIYGKNVGTITNVGTIKMESNAVGIYGENAAITNIGSIQNAGGNNTGIYGIGGSASNNGTISMGNTSNGVFLKNGTSISNTGNITVGDTKSSGLYGAGTTAVNHLSGIISVGKSSVGVASETGNVTVSSGAAINAGIESTYVYTESGIGTLDANLTLSDYSLGMYTKDGTMINNATITVGKSSVVSGNEKISVGMATGTSKTVSGSIVYIGGGRIINNGTINVPYDNGVGMIANNPTGIAINNGVINVYGKDSYGIQGSEGAVLTNKGYINVIGTGVRGIGVTSGAIAINDVTGKIEVTGTNASGIYAINGGEIWNNGEIIIDGTGRTAIYLGNGGILRNAGTITVRNGATDKVTDESATTSNIGLITMESDGPTITIGDTVYDLPTLINNGYIEYEDTALDFGKIKIGSTDGYIGTISAESFTNGELIVLPTATQGDNKPIKVIQYLKGVINVPNNGSLKAISHSVTWLADIQSDPTDPNINRIVMVKIPYAEIAKGTPAIEFGKGLDEIYEPAKGTELKMFDAIDMISDKDELGSTFDMELRGNVYSNIQQRMLDVRETYEKTYEELKDERTYTKNSMKIGAIISGGDTKYKNPGVEDYKYKTTGFMILKEYDHERFGRKTDWDIGFTYTKFDFDYGSEETVYSINIGAGYEDYIGNSKNLKWYTRIEADINRHETERKIHLSNGIYTNDGKYWTYMANWKNKIRYDMTSENGNIKGGIFGTFNLGYGRIENFKEDGDGIYLDIKEKDMLMIRPGIGADITYVKYFKRGKIYLTGKVSAEYELGKVYDGANEAKIKGTRAGYYELEEPKEVKGIVKVGAQLKYESKAGNSVGINITRNIGNVDSIRYGLNFVYRIGN